MAQVNIVVSASNQTASGFAGVQSGLVNLKQTTVQTTQATTQMSRADIQLAQLKQRVAAASTDAAGRVRLYTQAMNQSTAGSAQFYQAQLKVLAAEKEVTRAASGGGAGGFLRGAAGQLLGGLGIAGGIQQGIGLFKQYADEGQRVQVTLDQTRGSLGALLRDQERANMIIRQANQFGEKYKITQEDIAAALQASSQVIRTSTAPVERLLSVLGRLQALSPEQSLAEASLALRELQGGDIASLRRRFEVTSDAANQMKREIEGGADAVLVLDRYLTSIGISDGTLAASLSGAAGRQRDYNKAVEDLGLKINNVVTSAGWRSFTTGLIQSTASEIDLLGKLGQRIDEIGKHEREQPIQRFINNFIDNGLQRPLDAFVQNVGVRLGLVQLGIDRYTKGAEMRSERETNFAAPATPSPSRSSRATRFSGFGIQRSDYVSMASPAPVAPAQVNVIIQTGAVLSTPRDLADYMKDATKDDAFRNAIEVIGGR